MEKAVGRLFAFVEKVPPEHKQELTELASEFGKWSDAMFSRDDLNEMANNINEGIEELASTIKYNLALKDVIDFAQKRFGDESPIRLNKEALEEIKSAIQVLEGKLDKINKIRTLMDLERMLYV